jgi:hypothetical protein
MKSTLAKLFLMKEAELQLSLAMRLPTGAITFPSSFGVVLIGIPFQTGDAAERWIHYKINLFAVH